MPLEFPGPFPFRTLKTMRAAMYGGERLLEALTREGFSLYWEEGGAPKGFSEADEDGPESEISRRICEGPGAKQALTAATTDESYYTIALVRIGFTIATGLLWLT